MNRKKEQLRELWTRYKSLLGQTNANRAEPSPQAKEAKELYETQIWPLTKEGFTDRGQERYAASFHTVGTTPEPVILSARALDAEKVYLLHTKDTEKLCERIRSELGWGVDRVKPLLVSRSDPEDIYRQVREQVDRINPAEPVAFDPTGGTKAMVSGLAMFAFSLAEEGRVAHVYYVDNEEYDEQLRRPVAGTEFLKRLENPRDVIPDWLCNRAKEAYLQGDFSRAKKNFIQAAEREDKAHSLEAVLSEAYESLDSAQFAQAKAKLEELLNLLQKHPYKQSPLAKYTDAIAAQKEGLEAVIRLADALSGKERSIAPLAEPTTAAWTLAALDFMATRRLDAGRIAEAVLLRYRALEFFLQHRLALRGLDTAKPDYQKLCETVQMSLEDLQNKYQAERAKAGLKSEEKLEQKTAVDFVTAFFLLRALGDEATLAVNPNKLVGLAKARNSSVFAHGFEPPKQGMADDLVHVLQALVEKGVLPQVAYNPIPLA
ncbi:TIGR02710 family CRISPR-associated CARF protein [Meiothermus sp. CFH 77666]|uniref:TIGR02710 family CRISPR-associated CARF protein n=1 Tax=Meiothermus sp. CFH 77666 TaxID=2817942 RepID=UPI001AA0624B|nr:TIGR02710 family CRISPR-associated CARF protein [Meiothermus sp. CFH 77666]MBO1438267.1 TIGR02710 family CRISPR-associated protein [Meiothermus sp. CFH 77666]